MTTLASVDRIRAEAMALDPAKVLLFAVLLPFMLLGRIARLGWYVLAFALIAIKDGWKQQSGWLDERESRKAIT